MRLALVLLCCCSCRQPSWQPEAETAEPAAPGPLSLRVLGVQRHEIERTALSWLSGTLRRSFYARNDSMRLQLENGSAEPIYVYRDMTSIRRGTLELRQLPWRNSGSSADCHWSDPRYLRIEARQRLSWSLTIPPDLKTSVIEVAWSDRPLVARGGGCRQPRSQELVDLERGVLTAAIGAPGGRIGRGR